MFVLKHNYYKGVSYIAQATNYWMNFYYRKVHVQLSDGCFTSEISL